MWEVSRTERRTLNGSHRLPISSRACRPSYRGYHIHYLGHIQQTVKKLRDYAIFLLRSCNLFCNICIPTMDVG